jgi:hypothetical protein
LKSQNGAPSECRKQRSIVVFARRIQSKLKTCRGKVKIAECQKMGKLELAPGAPVSFRASGEVPDPVLPADSAGDRRLAAYCSMGQLKTLDYKSGMGRGGKY